MTIYKITYRQLRHDPEMGELLSVLERAFSKFQIDYFLVGAVARDVWMGGVHNYPPKRVTTDLDFAILINEVGLYEQLKQLLIAEEEFYPIKATAFTLIWRDKWQVDLMPFGEIEKDGKVTVTGTGLTTLQVDGFNEVYGSILPVMDIEGEHAFKCCTLPGIVLLKFIGWDDRPEDRVKDIKDISYILQRYFDMMDAVIYEEHLDLFDDEKIEVMQMIEIASQALGREIGTIIKSNTALTQRVQQILDESTSDINRSRIGDIMSSELDKPVDYCVTLLQRMKRGIEERTQS